MLDKSINIEDLKRLSLHLKDKIPYLKMLVLFGSRATGRIHANSDWDFAVLYDEEKRQDYMLNPFSWFEVAGILALEFNIPDKDTCIDVVELNHCSALLAHFIARDGKVLYETKPQEFENFRQLSLLTNSEIKNIEKAKIQKIDDFLQEWNS